MFRELLHAPQMFAHSDLFKTQKSWEGSKCGDEVEYPTTHFDISGDCNFTLLDAQSPLDLTASAASVHTHDQNFSQPDFFESSYKK